MRTTEAKRYLSKMSEVKPYDEYKALSLEPKELNLRLRGRACLQTPFSAAKMGMVEIMSVDHYLRQKSHQRDRTYRGVGQLMYFNAGIFPATVESFDEFNEIYLSYFSDLDFFGMWVWGPEPHGPTEKLVYEEYAPNSTIVGCDWMPWHNEEPWTSQLKGKRVLVISPFADTIQKQYTKRDLLWDNPDMLPQFDELRTIKCPLSAGLSESPFASWKEGLSSMEKQMSQIDFDVCFVGAGAWGLPLAVHAKRLGKIGIHSGGDTQLLFGIKGKRWDDNPDMSKRLYNEHWVRPSESETPRDKTLIEGGCYW